MATKIGILGTGEVGQSLGRAFAAEGHDVKMGSREAGNEKAKAWVAKTGAKASAGTFADAAAFGDVIALCTLWSGTQAALEAAGTANFAGKVVIDVTNPLTFAPNAPPALERGHTDSGGEQVQRWLPKARVVKAFNTVGNALFYKPELPNGPPSMFYAGNDADAKKTVAEICSAFGWEPIDVGGIDGSRLLEPMCILWVLHGVRSGKWSHAFKLLHP